MRPLPFPGSGDFLTISYQTGGPPALRAVGYHPFIFMARRPKIPAKIVMTREDLKQMRRSLSMLSAQTVQDNYETLLERCRLRAGSAPPPCVMQELVTLWKVLWQWRRTATQ